MTYALHSVAAGVVRALQDADQSAGRAWPPGEGRGESLLAVPPPGGCAPAKRACTTSGWLAAALAEPSQLAFSDLFHPALPRRLCNPL